MAKLEARKREEVAQSGATKEVIDSSSDYLRASVPLPEAIYNRRYDSED